jgi:hypothetical protein
MKKTRRHLYILIISLLLTGISIFCYRHWILDVPLTNSENIDSWVVEANLHFHAEAQKPIKINLAIPYLPPSFVILDEYFVAPNYGISTQLSDYNRYATWTLRRGTGEQSLFYRVVLRRTEHEGGTLPKPSVLKLKSHNARVLPEYEKNAVLAIIQQARQSSADIQTFAQNTIAILNKHDSIAKLLVGNHFDNETLVNTAITVLNQAHIDALPVRIIHLNQQNKADFQWTLAVYNTKEWIYIDPQTGSMGLGKNILVWQYGPDPAYRISGGIKPQWTLSVSQTPLNALSVAKAHGQQINSQLLRFSLLQLPVNLQETYKILLTVPIGAFMILLLRNFIGLKTFGTFMPVLIALAFRETHVIFGVILFSLIVSLGLLARFYLDQLRLLLVPRLASILTIVILLMIFISVLSQNLNLTAGLSVALFPMIILTMTIERMCITWDERGAAEAMKSGLGSLLAAIIAYSAMSYEPLQYLFFAFPELLFILLAMTLLFGQYRGYRLMELKRFKALAEAQ